MDIFVKVDYISGDEPSPTGLDKIENAYASAPIDNPDGSEGISLHMIVDDSIPSDGQTTATDQIRMTNSYFDRESDGYHYAVAVEHAVIDGKSVTGFATYGKFVFKTDYTNSQDWRSDYTASIFMRELGHSVGIHAETYEGVDSREISHSEYASVMNYNAPDDLIEYSSSEPFSDWKYIEDYIHTPSVEDDR
jgi:hypothetical protein